MVRKLFICLLLLFSFNSIVFGAEYVMTEELAQEILDYYRQGPEYWGGIPEYINNNSNAQYFLNNITTQNFLNYFNTYMEEANFEKTGSFSNLTVLFNADSTNNFSFTFFQTNNTTPNGLELPYLNLIENSPSITYNIYFTGTDSISDNTDKNIDYLTLTFNSSGNLSTAKSYTSKTSRYLSNINFNEDENIIYIPSLLALSKSQFLYFTPYNGEKNGYFLGNTVSGNYDPLPEIPSGDTGGESSGDTGGESSGDTGGESSGDIVTPDYKEQLGNIQTGINNIENKITTSGDIQQLMSGEVGKVTETLTTVPDLSGETITSGEIEAALNIEFMADPYDNFWYELTTGLSHALTDDVRQFDIPWINGYKQTFNLDTWGLKFPPSIEFILMSVSTVSLTWVIVKYWKIIVDKISSGSIDEVLAMNEEEGIIDLF